MFQQVIDEDLANWYRFKHFMADNNVLLVKNPDSKNTFGQVKKWIDDYPDVITNKIKKANDDFFQESDKSYNLSCWVEEETKNVVRHCNAKTVWSLYEHDLYLAFRKFIGERTLKKREKTFDHIEINPNTFNVTIYITNMFRNMDRALTFFTNKGASSVEFKIIPKID
jgi:hypothetical protein